MLIRFVVSNFLSFKEETEFNMLTSKGKSYQKHKDHVETSDSGVDILKMASIYGANASGKSNLVEAISYLQDIITEDNFNEILIPSSTRFRHDEECKNKPTSFRIEFISNATHYDYGIEIFKGEIIEEWLYLIDNVKKESEFELFKRVKNEVSFGDFFKDDDISYIKQYLKKELNTRQSALNAIFGRIENNHIIDYAFESFLNLIIISPNSFNSSYINSTLKNENKKKFLENILKSSKTGVSKLVVQKITADKFFGYEDNDYKQQIIDKYENKLNSADNDFKDQIPLMSFGGRREYHYFCKAENDYYVLVFKTKHDASDNTFQLNEESDGTNRLIELVPAFYYLINNKNTTFIIDELERSMHPILAKELVKMFSESKTSSSQLIFTTHESHLLDLDIFRQDEIWFTEKRKDGSTEFYPLSKFKPREDKDIRRGYLQGRYGGIPFLGDFSKVINE